MKSCKTHFPICLAVLECENIKKKGYDFVIFKKAEPF